MTEGPLRLSPWTGRANGQVSSRTATCPESGRCQMAMEDRGSGAIERQGGVRVFPMFVTDKRAGGLNNKWGDGVGGGSSSLLGGENLTPP